MRAGAAPLELSDPGKSRVDRIEVRAGKDHLKDRFGVTGWQTLLDALPIFLEEAFDVVRYTVPDGDSNRSRWPDHPLWIAARRVARDLHVTTRSPAPRERFIEEKRQHKIELLFGQALGLATSVAALTGITPDKFLTYLGDLHAEPARRSTLHPIPLHERLTKASERYEHLHD